jgi:hypothetical protein
MPRPIGYKVNVQLWDVCSLLWCLRQRGGVCLHVQMQNTPLYVAAGMGHEAVTRVLVEGGADVNVKNLVVQSKCAVVGCVLMGVVSEAAWWRVSACAGAGHPAACGGWNGPRGGDEGAGRGRGRRECQESCGTK